jgi:O-methyltransferase involved in polyketide biosynthesis
MDESRASLTALVTAYCRAYHATHDSPTIFNDFLADRMFTEEEHATFDRNLAGLLTVGTFAFRRPDLMDRLRVCEVDHPATQALKHGRLAMLAQPYPPQLRFVQGRTDEYHAFEHVHFARAIVA